MTDLWTEASLDHEELARTAALARAEAEFAGVFPFLAAARTEGEYAHRRALAEERLTSIALRHGMDPGELLKLADRRWALLVEALTEGQGPLEWIPDGGGYGSGPEKPDEHDEGPDFSHGYSEVPQGAPGGPDPSVVAPMSSHPGPVQEATGRHHKGLGKHRKKADMSSAPDGGSYLAAEPPDTGTGAGSVDMGTSPASATLPAGVGDSPAPMTPPSIGQVTSSADPVRRQVMAVTASIQATNPGVSDEEAGRLARRVVGQYLSRSADLSSSVVDNDPGEGSDGGSGGGGMNGMEKAMVGRTVVKALPELAETLLA